MPTSEIVIEKQNTLVKNKYFIYKSNLDAA